MSDPDLTDWRTQRHTRIEHLERILDALEDVVARLEALEETASNRVALDLITELAKRPEAPPR